MTTSPAPHLPGSPLSDADLAGIRAALPAVERSTYLNAGTLGPLPTVAIEAMRVEVEYDSLRRQCDSLWERLGERQVAARGALTSLTGVGPEQVALMHTTHEGINTCLWGLAPSAGQSIVTTDQEHPGVTVPLRHLRDRTGVEVRIATWRSESDEAFVEQLVARVDANTVAVVLSHVSWVTGAIAPLRALRDALPEGCRVIVDGAQSAGVLATDPEDGWDAYTVSGQKWPCGPNGSGGLALVDPEAWQPTFGAYLHLADPYTPFTSDVVAEARRFETSQESMVPLAGFAAAVDWLVQEVGQWRALGHARALNAHARERFAGVLDSSATLQGDAHLLCIDLGRPVADTVVTDLCRAGISIRPLAPSVIRLSFGAWNTAAEVDAAVDAVGSSLSAG